MLAIYMGALGFQAQNAAQVYVAWAQVQVSSI
jgi:hypothetical protein